MSAKCDALKCQKCFMLFFSYHKTSQFIVNRFYRPAWKLKSILPSFPLTLTSQLQSSKTTLTCKGWLSVGKTRKILSWTDSLKLESLYSFFFKQKIKIHLKSLSRVFASVRQCKRYEWLCRASINSENARLHTFDDALILCVRGRLKIFELQTGTAR